jgi:hypothetical protein
MAIEPISLVQLQSLHELERLNADFCYFLDHNQVSDLVGLFTEDAYYQHGPRISEGRKAIGEIFERRVSGSVRTARHLQSGLRIEFLDEYRATGQSVCATFAANEAPPVATTDIHLVADFEDEYQKGEDGRWRIRRREIRRIFVHESNLAPVSFGINEDKEKIEGIDP